MDIMIGLHIVTYFTVGLLSLLFVITTKASCVHCKLLYNKMQSWTSNESDDQTVSSNLEVRDSLMVSLLSSFTSEKEEKLNFRNKQSYHRNEKQEEQERSEEYCKGGYHPLKIGDRLHRNRYLVIRKLGWGTFSTVWLCLDTKVNNYVAIKIVKSCKSYRETAEEEIEMLINVSKADPSHPFNKRIVSLLNHFKLRGVNGKHICLVFEILGDSLYKFMIQSYDNGMSLEVLKTVIRQVLEGLNYLHSKCQIIHTDIKPENILLTTDKNKAKRLHSEVEKLVRVCGIEQLPDSLVSMAPTDVQQRSDDYIKNKLNKSQKLNSKKDKNNNIELNDIPSKTLTETPSELSIKIADLGNACYINQKFTSTIQTRPYRSPEVIIGSSYGTSADIWSVACMTFELATGHLLFDAHAGEDYSRNEDHLAKMIQLLGPLPKHCRKGRYYHNYFTKCGQLLHFKILKQISLEQVLVDQYKWDLENAKSFAQFLLPMLQFDCQKRWTASECLNHPWIKS